MSNPRVILINSIFPALSETFLFSQYSIMLNDGLDMKIVSSNRPAPGQVHPGMEPMQQQVDYLCDASAGEMLAAHLHALRRYPRGYLKSLGAVFSAEEKPKTSLAHITGAALILQRYVGEERPWIHAHFTYGACAIAMWLSRIAGLGYSLTLHGSDLTFDNPPDLAAKLREASVVVSISEYNKRYVTEYFPGVNADRQTVLPLGVKRLAQPPEDLLPNRSGALRLLSVGRLSSQKAQHILIQACARLRDQGLAFQCDLVGEGECRAQLERLITELELTEQVRLLGAKYHDEVLALYAQADLFVMSSVAEGMPIVIMEAMQAGVPVVSTDVSGIPELLDHGRAGILVPPGDVARLSEALARVIRGEVDVQQLRQYAIAHIAANFDQTTNAVRFRQLLEKLAQQQGGEVSL